MKRVLLLVVALAAAGGPAGWAMGDAPIVAWRCLSSSSAMWQPAGCPARTDDARPRSAAPVIAPSGPTALAAAVSGARVTLTWAASAAGDPPTSYVVEAGSATGRADITSFDTRSTSTTLIVDSVPAGTYFVRVRGRNGAGVGSVSNETIVTVGTTTVCSTRPNAPGTLTATVSGSSVTLNWSAPSGTCAATSYAIEAGSATGLSNLANVDTGSAATTFSATSVMAGTYFVRVKAVNAAGSSTASNEITLTVGAPPPAISCASWASQQRGAGVPPATGSIASLRTDLYNAGGGIRAVGNRYYAAYFPAGFATARQRRVLIALHGTGGAPEQQWSLDWGTQVDARGYGLLGLKYLDDNTGFYDDDATIYANITAMVDDVASSCDFASTSLFLAGYSRGSAESFPVAYHDRNGRRLFKAVANNSGAWVLTMPMPATLQGIVSRNETTAFSGARFWMYCGGLDMEHGYPMCDEMQNARTFIQMYGGTVAALFQDPTGAHGGLTRNSTALSQMFAYFESLP